MRVELRQVGLCYQQRTPFETEALVDVSLKVDPGERVGITGPVGSGKSTLLEVLAGLRQPTTGQVVYDGCVFKSKAGPPQGRIGIAFQFPENCLFDKTVIADVCFGPKSMGLDKETCRCRAEAALAAMGLDPVLFANLSPFSLSMGQQRRVALAGVLALEPEVLLLDEPTAFLDAGSRRDLIERLVVMNEATGMTIVVVGHDMDEMACFANRLVIIDRGRKVADGPAARLLTNTDLLDRHGLEAPATVRLSRLLQAALGETVPTFLTKEEAEKYLLELLGE
jgi:energy-coupling factor transport system ATP-binding protein